MSKYSEHDILDCDIIYRIGSYFTSQTDLESALNAAIDYITGLCGFSKIMVHTFMKDEEAGIVDISRGYSSSEIERGTYKIGEGIIGRVLKSGAPEIIPVIRNSPEFLNKTESRSEEDLDSAFLCVPVSVAEKNIGTISADLPGGLTEHELMKSAAVLCLTAVMSAQALNSRIEMLHQERRLEEENKKLKIKLSKSSRSSMRLIGQSTIMQDLIEKILLVSETDTTVLISGESGTGKELVAEAIQQNSKRSEKPYIKVNIAALPENLIESELFGHEKGAFTGAVSQKKGRFETANGGTIFLDEIGDLSYPLQVKLLRVLQERTVERLGGTTIIPIDVRIIAATHQNLEQMIENGQFRSDLYYRLNVFPLLVPPLRDRRADILSLVDFFIERFSSETGKSINRISTEAINMLTAYHWPGNVRELENCIHRAVIIAEDGVIRNYNLPPTLQMAQNTENTASFDLMVQNFEREIITDYLKMTGGNITQAADLLGTTKRILTYKVKKLEIDYKTYKINSSLISDNE